MEKTAAGSNNNRTTRMAFLSIGLSIVALIIDFILRKPLVDSISAGFALAFVSFLLSLSSVRDHGSNLLAQIAFWFGFAAMWGTLALCLL